MRAILAEEGRTALHAPARERAPLVGVDGAGERSDALLRAAGA